MYRMHCKYLERCEHRWNHELWISSPNFPKFKIAPMRLSENQGAWFMEKTQTYKSHDTVPLPAQKSLWTFDWHWQFGHMELWHLITLFPKDKDILISHNFGPFYKQSYWYFAVHFFKFSQFKYELVPVCYCRSCTVKQEVVASPGITKLIFCLNQGIKIVNYQQIKLSLRFLYIYMKQLLFCLVIGWSRKWLFLLMRNS